MAAPLQQPRVEGAGTRGRDEGHAALVSSRKRPRVVAETHDDSVAFARAASLRASDYGAWLSECKTRWRSLRNKLALVRNFVKLEANGDSLELGGILDPTGARAREKKRGFSRWKTVRAEEVRVGDIPHLTGDFKRLLAMLEAHPVTGGRAPPGDGKETGGEGAAAAADAADAAADAAAGASRFAFEGERLEDSDDDLTSSASDDADEDDLDEDDLDEDDSDEDADDRLGRRGTEGGTERPSGAHLQTSRRLAASVASAEPERSAADALAAYGDDPQPPPPPSFAPPPSAFATLPHAAVARVARDARDAHAAAPAAAATERPYAVVAARGAGAPPPARRARWRRTASTRYPFFRRRSSHRRRASRTRAPARRRARAARGSRRPRRDDASDLLARRAFEPARFRGPMAPPGFGTIERLIGSARVHKYRRVFAPKRGVWQSGRGGV